MNLIRSKVSWRYIHLAFALLLEQNPKINTEVHGFLLNLLFIKERVVFHVINIGIYMNCKIFRP